MARRLTAVFVATLLMLLAFPARPGAHTVVLTPKVSRTKIPKGAVERGDVVVILGRVATSDSTCFAGVLVELVRIRQGVEKILEVDQADAQGEYAFKRRPRRDERLFARFPGFVEVVAGHSHTCGAAVSRVVRIRVRG